jgi:hypothetical protein
MILLSAFDCMLKCTGASIECLSDIDMILFLESNIRGGVSFINTRHCEASSEKNATADPSTSSASTSGDKMLYIDANNL